MAGIERNRAPEAVLGLVELPEVEQRPAEVVVPHRTLRIEAQVFPKGLGRLGLIRVGVVGSAEREPGPLVVGTESNSLLRGGEHLLTELDTRCEISERLPRIHGVRLASRGVPERLNRLVVSPKTDEAIPP